MAPSVPELEGAQSNVEERAAALEPRYIITVGTQAPLTTVWTAPGSCATAIPTVSAGICNTRSCSAYVPSVAAQVLSSYGASVNYPDFTTSQQQTSTECMPPGYANLKWFYFTGGSKCPADWATATTTTDTNAMTIHFDCFTAIAAAQQTFTLDAEGYIPTTQIGTSDYVPSWVSRSIIGTTALPLATPAIVYHPGVNFLVDLPGAGAGASSTRGRGTGAIPSGTGVGVPSSAVSASAHLRLFGLGFGASIGIILGIIAVCLLACILTALGCWRRIRRRKQVPVQPYPQTYQQQNAY
ncbi:hypothetical protein BCR34DRAFT_646021 [Clohesyomyces aquaticus]|uniref:Uncharacterized protein n=1 Tax=Clohesyomyces aquaticus TaxID=1231657 RepID=A0A1Y1Y7W5_9PLEO|nr:hypothetical protein BCR34DRAFT_646021 [Clohesyomyces aquaticus]